MSAPPRVMLPLFTSQNDAMSLAMVDFPLPDGPTSAFTVPSRKVRFTPCSTCVSLYPNCTTPSSIVLFFGVSVSV